MGIDAVIPSLSTCGETLTIEESMNLERRTGQRRVGEEHEMEPRLRMMLPPVAKTTEASQS